MLLYQEDYSRLGKVETALSKPALMSRGHLMDLQQLPPAG
jgi:hypothetical protein